MKLALVGTSLYGQGAEFVLASVAKGLAERGHSVDVIVSGVHEDIAKSNQNIKPFDIGSRAKLIIMRAKRGRHSVLELRKLLTNGRYDIVMCHTAPYAIPLIFAAAFTIKRPKLVYVEHLGGIGVGFHGEKVKPHISIGGFLKNIIMRRYDAQFAVSKGTLEAMHTTTGYPNSRLHLVYNPVLDENFTYKRSLVPQHPWLSEVVLPTVVAAGAFSGIKHFELLIEAFSIVRKVMPCRLVIFGEGPLRTKYEQMIAEFGLLDDVSLPGFTNQLPAELGKAACFVVSSYVESFSIVLVEALACGVPVVSVDAPYGPREILEDGKNGILVENDNVKALADGILQVLSGNGITPDQTMIRRFTSEVVMQHYEEIIKEIVNGDKHT